MISAGNIGISRILVVGRGSGGTAPKIVWFTLQTLVNVGNNLFEKCSSTFGKS